MKPVTDRAEVSIDFPDKAYMGYFGRESAFEVKADADEVLLRLVRPGEERREVALHLHYYLLADVLAGVAEALSTAPPLDAAHREPLQAAADALGKAVRGKAAKRSRR